MTAALLAELAAKVRRSARTQTAKYFTRWRFPHRNLASIRFSRYVAVGSPAESAFTYADYTRRRRFSYGISTVRLRFLLSAKAGGFLGAKSVKRFASRRPGGLVEIDPRGHEPGITQERAEGYPLMRDPLGS